MSVDQIGSKKKNLLKLRNDTVKEKVFLSHTFIKGFSWFHQTVQEKKQQTLQLKNK